MQNSYLELRPDTPLVEICDNKRVLIENHRGVICYGVKEIIVKVKKGIGLNKQSKLEGIRKNNFIIFNKTNI